MIGGLGVCVVMCGGALMGRGGGVFMNVGVGHPMDGVLRNQKM